jgi:Holliday junction resolvasome RuvABC endonuclease subunit
MPKKEPIKILAIDQSYSRLGYCVLTKRDVLEINSVRLDRLKNPTQKRNCVRELVQILVRKYQPKAIIVERTRIFHGGYISAKTAGMMASLTATIVDAAYMHNEFRKPTPVFSVDTGVWKYAVLGSQKASKDDAVKWTESEIGEIPEKVFGVPINHDSADAYCIGRYVWYPNPKLQRER